MIRLLNTVEINSELKKMFKEEKEHLIIVSPYIWENNDLEELEKLLKASPAKIDFLVRRPEPEELKDSNEKSKDAKKIEAIENILKNVKFKKITRLHAKAYISKKYSIITSVNMTIHSQTDNFELGILFNNSVYPELYIKLIQEINSILELEKEDKVIENPSDNIRGNRLINKLKRLF